MVSGPSSPIVYFQLLVDIGHMIFTVWGLMNNRLAISALVIPVAIRLGPLPGE